MRKDIGKKSVAARIKSTTEIRGNIDSVIVQYAKILSDSGCKLIPSRAKRKRIEYTNKMMKVAKAIAKKCYDEQTTEAVKIVENQLLQLGLPYVREKPVTYRFSKKEKGVKIYVLDFYLPKPLNFIIEVDGYHHIETKEYDKLRDSRMSDKGLGTTLRIFNSTVMKPGFNLLDKILKMKWAGPKVKAYLDLKNKPRK
jgi:very-short-patch-repair endonuclease